MEEVLVFFCLLRVGSETRNILSVAVKEGFVNLALALINRK
ncbi:MAG: hypothetical protein RMI63_04620 [Caldimicrobium sp.]|nr:hypothetical protein [Caldimicrobium sp.]